MGGKFSSNPLPSNWAKLRKLVIRRSVAKYGFAKCEHPGCGAKGTDVDHIIERGDGGSSGDVNNMWLLCKGHHKEKTKISKLRRNLRKR